MNERGCEAVDLENNIGKPHSLIVGETRGIGRVLVRTLADVGHVLSVIG